MLRLLRSGGLGSGRRFASSASSSSAARRWAPPPPPPPPLPPPSLPPPPPPPPWGRRRLRMAVQCLQYDERCRDAAFRDEHVTDELYGRVVVSLRREMASNASLPPLLEKAAALVAEEPTLLDWRATNATAAADDEASLL